MKLELTLDEAEQFVEKSPRAQWNGWDIEILRPQTNAHLRPNGTLHKGLWCLKSTIIPNSEGKYVITKGNATNAVKSWD